MNPISIRLLNQQLASPVFSDPADVVSHMGAIQAQEYRLMRWAVAMRTQKPSSQAFTKAYNEGRIIRLHLLRGTWQLVADEDYVWMLQLCAPKSISVIKGWMHSNGINIPPKEFASISDILCRTAEENGSVTKEDFVEALSHKGITMDDHRLSYHIRMAELNGLLCSGDLLPTKATYSLASQKVSPHPNTTNEDALLMLTRKYFQSHSPATLKDFAWWSGMNTGDCRKSIGLLATNCKTNHGKAKSSMYMIRAVHGASARDKPSLCPHTTNTSSLTKAATLCFLPNIVIEHIATTVSFIR